ncbi:DUF1853 family protein [Christiangramia flava]|uniref:Uncharacterized protein n=1 Tax=Christiangramia flava JLT2011 TaxID=1229726 RepID=A0A1L7IAS1_9FLAO|nr:DUF1853 family protein [Christiangramia flava]APU70205.1 hypothetical protein GRFL_3481 [Christiangramia flava JLT2011]OSS39691.1 hypothetical protein C723_1593 [Christiangramia flava JLT2011]
MSELEDQFLGFCRTPDIRKLESPRSYPVFEFPKITMNENIRRELKQMPSKGTSILGKRMEAFFKIAISQSERYHLLAHSIQVIEGKRTLGELDFLLRDTENGKILHVELVYKLYLYDPGFASENDRWIGPKRKDRYSYKIQKLTKNQFPLLHHPATATYLERLGIDPAQVEQQLCFKAQLFAQPAQLQEDFQVNENCLIGHWIIYAEFLSGDYENCQFVSPPKVSWSAGPDSGSHWKSFTEIQKTIDRLFSEGQVPLLWMKNSSDYSSFFVVNW